MSAPASNPSDLSSTSNAALEERNICTVADEVWDLLVAASSVEKPLSIKPFYNEGVKQEEQLLKFPKEMSRDEFLSVFPKTKWTANVKFSSFNINKLSEDCPVRLAHLVVVVAWKVKVFGEDAYGKVSSRCKLGAGVVNELLVRNCVFFPMGSGKNRTPVRVHQLNDETFKTNVLDLLKFISDTNIQRHYVGDGDGDVSLAGVGLPAGALTSGAQPGSEILFKRALHEVKGLVDSQLYLKNPRSADVLAQRQQQNLLDSINKVVNGQRINTVGDNEGGNNGSGSDNVIDVEVSGITTRRASPTSNITEASANRRQSPAVTMAEATLLSQQAALKEAENYDKLISLQKEELDLKKLEMEMRKEAEKIERDYRLEEMRLMQQERNSNSVALQKLVDKMCPEEDPIDKFTARKRKLDEARIVLGEELYNAKIKQLTEQFKNSSAF